MFSRSDNNGGDAFAQFLKKDELSGIPFAELSRGLLDQSVRYNRSQRECKPRSAPSDDQPIYRSMYFFVHIAKSIYLSILYVTTRARETERERAGPKNTIIHSRQAIQIISAKKEQRIIIQPDNINAHSRQHSVYNTHTVPH